MSLLGRSSSLSPWAGPYVTDMLGKGKALAEEPYQAYTGELVAGPSQLQSNAFQGLAGLAVPQATMSGTFSGTPYTPPTSDSLLNAGMPSQDQSYNSFALSPVDGLPSQPLGTGVMGAMGMQPQQPNMIQNYMNPYLETALAPQYAQAQRDYQKAQRDLQGRYSQAGAYGGSRQGVAEGELMSGALQNLSAITGRGYEQAYDKAVDQFTKDREYGLGALKDMADMGATQRQIEQQGISADLAQFESERDDPFKKVQYMQSLLQGLPISTQDYEYTEPSGLSNFMGGAGGILGLLDTIGLFGD
jgi:hypothetical protein